MVFNLTIKIEADSAPQAQTLGNQIQKVVNNKNVNNDSLIKLLTKVNEDPNLVKKAMMFI